MTRNEGQTSVSKGLLHLLELTVEVYVKGAELPNVSFRWGVNWGFG